MTDYTSERLEELLAEATVDCYGEDEQLMGLFTMISEELRLPFATTILGVEAVAEDLDLRDGTGIVVLCRRGGHGPQAIGLLDVPLPDPAPEGAEWIEVYRRWAR
ncbi:hypothetical protein [Streptomyces incanus]